MGSEPLKALRRLTLPRAAPASTGPAVAEMQSNGAALDKLKLHTWIAEQ